MCLRPSCTKNVWPTNSGDTVERRAQVLIGSFLADIVSSFTFLRSFSSTNGPFLSKRPITFPGGGLPGGGLASDFQLAVTARLATANNGFGRRLATFARAASLGEHAGRAARMPSARAAAFAAAHRVSDRVHGDAADMGTPSHPSLASRLADRNVDMVGIADHAHGRAARAGEPPHFTGRQRDLGPLPFAGVHHRVHAGRTAQLAAASRLHFDAVNLRARRNLFQRHRVADVGLNCQSALDLVADLQPLGGEDVALLAVGIMQQRDAGRAIGIVFDEGNLRRDAVLVPVEVDHSVNLLVPAAAVPGRNATLEVAAALLLHPEREELFRLLFRIGDLRKIAHRARAASGRGRLVFSYAHRNSPDDSTGSNLALKLRLRRILRRTQSDLRDSARRSPSSTKRCGPP